MSRYDDIINLPHHQSTKYPHMSLHDRAAQFAPFAALKGYEEAVAETARLTDSKAVLDDNEIELLDAKLQYISENIQSSITVSVTYYVPDTKKIGGAYVDTTGMVVKVDSYSHFLVLENEQYIPIDDIFDIKIE